jgi:hypothetical protein
MVERRQQQSGPMSQSMPGASLELNRPDGVTERYGNGAAPAVADVSLAVLTAPGGSESRRRGS